MRLDSVAALRQELLAAAARLATGPAEDRGASSIDPPPRSSRLRRRWRSRPLALVVVLCLGGATGALAAAGVFRTGAPVGSSLPPATPSGTPLALTATGVAIPGSVRVLPLRVGDPAGGPPWGLRIERTTRGLICVQPGRIVNGKIGAIGIDRAFHNDGRFHPFSNNYQSESGCAIADAHGHAFVAARVDQEPASAIEGSCNPRPVNSAPPRSGAFRYTFSSPRGRFCPADAMRSVAWGMLGPDAVRYAYPTPGGPLVTRATSGPDGAYLIVGPTSAVCSLAGGPARPVQCEVTVDPRFLSGVITKVIYRSGRTCRPAANLAPGCPEIGYARTAAKPVTSAQVASPVTVRYLGRATPRGLDGNGPPEYAVVVSFIARAPVTSAASQYDITEQYPRSCGGGFGGAPVLNDTRAGQRISRRQFINTRCVGTFHGTVSYNTTTRVGGGPTGLNLFPIAPGRTPQAIVGRFTITIPHH